MKIDNTVKVFLTKDDIARAVKKYIAEVAPNLNLDAADVMFHIKEATGGDYYDPRDEYVPTHLTGCTVSATDEVK